MAASSVNDPMVTVNVCAGLVHPFALAKTEILPPADPTTVVIELVIEVPVHPLGNDQVYELAPLTGVIKYV